AAAGVADHVGVADVEPECPFGMDARIHAGEHGEVLGRRHRLVPVAELARELLVAVDEALDHTHGEPPGSLLKPYRLCRVLVQGLTRPRGVPRNVVQIVGADARWRRRESRRPGPAAELEGPARGATRRVHALEPWSSAARPS